jgi:hypothetical protein
VVKEQRKKAVVVRGKSMQTLGQSTSISRVSFAIASLNFPSRYCKSLDDLVVVSIFDLQSTTPQHKPSISTIRAHKTLLKIKAHK